MNVSIIIPVSTYNLEFLLHTAANLKQYNITYIVQSDESVATALEATGHKIIRLWQLNHKLKCNSPKILNQLIGIFANKDADLFIFIDADVLTTKRDIEILIDTIESGADVATGCRECVEPPMLTSWSLLSKKVGVYGGLFAVRSEWLYRHAIHSLRTAEADDWHVDQVARATGTKIHFTTAKAICKEKSIINFLASQYSWLHLYRPNLYLALFCLELILLFIPIKFVLILIKTRNIKLALSTIPLQFIIIFCSLKAIRKP